MSVEGKLKISMPLPNIQSEAYSQFKQQSPLL